jgi:DNA polymerase-3 subunit delta'
MQVQQMAHGAPLLAVDYLRHDAPAQRHQTLVDLTAILRNQISVSEVAESWAKDPLPQRLDWWLQWQQDLIKLQQTQDSQQVVNQDVIKLLQAIARKAEIKAVFGLYDDTLQALDSLSQRRNINQQLLLEKLLYGWYQLI